MRAGVAFDENYLATSGAIITYRTATNWVRLSSHSTRLNELFANST
jgi:hypothetical protein